MRATGAAGSGAAGDGSGAAGEATGSAGTGAAGDDTGAAGVGAAGSGGGGNVVAGSSGAAGDGAAGTGHGMAGAAGGAAGHVDAGADAGGTGGTGPSDGGAGHDGGGSSTILIYCVTTGFRHGSIPTAAASVTTAAATHGLKTEIVGCSDATNVADPSKFTAQALAGYGAVMLLANSGEPFGYPADTQIQNLIDYVHNGGALIAIEDADHCYSGSFNNHPATPAYINLIGNEFGGHPGGVALANCTKMGTHASVAQLPATFTTSDEIYSMNTFRMDNQIVLDCVSTAATNKAMRPVSYYREEGNGRVFYTALGHPNAVWTGPMEASAANTRLVEDHLIPALLWAMRR
jgi:type 1 glutamine amidotransferase